MANKMTKKDFYNVISAVFSNMDGKSFEVEGKGAVTGAQVCEFAAHEIDLLTRKASADRKPTAKQVENDARRVAIKAVLGDEGMTVSEIAEAVKGECGDLSGHQISALLSPMVKDGEVVRSKVKGVTYFALAVADAE